MQDDFYKKFEDKFRGTREDILGRVKFYLPFIEELLNHYPPMPVVDLGCGRGEWLELLSLEKIPAIGFDINLEMLDEPKKLGLNVKHEDALQALKKMPKASVIAVTGFHIAEHLNFETLKSLVRESLRVLVPGGLLILETPNPENIQVGSCSFYLDPTHLRPLPPALLSFIPEYYGFKRCIIARLQENNELIDNEKVTLMEVIQGVSPDYAVIAQKAAKKSIFQSFDNLFNLSYGITFDDLSDRFERLLQDDIRAPKEVANNIQAEWDQAKSKSNELAKELSVLQVEKAQLEGVLAAKQKELEGSWAGFAEKQKQADWLQAEWDQAKSKSNELAKELSVLQVEKAQLEGVLAAKQKELEGSWAGFAEKQKQADWLQAEWDQAKSKSNELAKELSVLQVEKAQLEGVLAARENELTLNQSNLSEKQKQLDDALTSNHYNWVLANQNEDALNQQREINSLLKAEMSDLQELYQQKINESYYWHERVLELHKSISWKITKPIRIFNRIKLKNGRNSISQVDGFNVKSYFLLKAFSFLYRHPKLRSTAINVLKVFPSIENFLKVERASLLNSQIKRVGELAASPDLKMHDTNDGHFLTVCDSKLAVDQILSNIRKELNLGDDLNK